MEPCAQPDGGPAAPLRLRHSGAGEEEQPQEVVISCAPGQAAGVLVEAVRRAGFEPVPARCWRDVIAALAAPDTTVLLAVGDRGSPTPDPARGEVHWDALRVDVEARIVSWQGTPVPVTPAQFEVLLALLRARGAAVQLQALASALHGRNSRGDAERVRAHVMRLRRRLRGADDAAGRVIVTVRGYGYRLARADYPSGQVEDQGQPGTVR